MVRISKTLYDNIDVGNLFSQWHPEVRAFVSNINQDCALYFLKNSKVLNFDTSRYKEVLNFTNTKQGKNILHRVLQEKKTESFLDLLRQRDELHPRYIDRGFTIEEIFQSVKKNEYHPILFLKLNEKLYIIDGRTRLYCCLFLKVPAKVRVVKDVLLTQNCKEE